MTVSYMQSHMTHQEYMNWIEYYNERGQKEATPQDEVLAKLRMV